MTDTDRRDFIKKSAAAAAALGISGTKAAASQAPIRPGETPPAETLRAVAAAVLPTSDLEPDDIDQIVTDFEAWIDDFEPVAEMPHGYLNRGLANIRYGPPHPGPRWAAQVEALELEAAKRYQSAFAELSIEERRALIQGQLGPDELGRLPSPGQARHVAVGLMAYFYASSEATDLCYRASIGRFKCRGLATLGRQPQPLPSGPRGEDT
ncbi:MAG: twin-arginine translocation signal domain-containing protein [Acidobacteria bacterium]|nr:twin-arginine translocation signal domain-containing protein [Acidobacteriota bacterium]